MNYLAIDYGTSKIGLAVNVGEIALPLKVVPNKGVIEEIKKIIKERKIEAMVVGIPSHVDGKIGKQALIVAEFVEKLRKSIGKKIIIYGFDERFSTYDAMTSLEYIGYDKKNIGQVDDMAASIILQGFFDYKGEKSIF
ncbi:MAG: Holliday junction resolvase RuvX [Candidatus Gracilibacteria bacterium]|nr:Holliday junction resolvase RuvX [Candidatus Gracilibacteria bacterium]MDD3119927.1 Holliday junction resolvase RuvX [Candidatus Gracilibacteria bacterium]MDD4530931.1 Holliday junction resolvase RuvX [Candidatus Gracilibacteria bacterium]